MCDREHLLTTCINADFVWKELENRLQPLFLGNIKRTEKIYGASEEDNSTRKQKNLVLLAAKIEIRRAYLEERPTTISSIMEKLKEWQKIEESICKKPSQIDQVRKLYHFLTYAVQR